MSLSGTHYHRFTLVDHYGAPGVRGGWSCGWLACCMSWPGSTWKTRDVPMLPMPVFSSLAPPTTNVLSGPFHPLIHVSILYFHSRVWGIFLYSWAVPGVSCPRRGRFRWGWCTWGCPGSTGRLPLRNGLRWPQAPDRRASLWFCRCPHFSNHLQTSLTVQSQSAWWNHPCWPSHFQPWCLCVRCPGSAHVKLPWRSFA